jgi:hypothetical protein
MDVDDGVEKGGGRGAGVHYMPDAEHNRWEIEGCLGIIGSVMKLEEMRNAAQGW